jgi:hypothetical protein
MYLYCVPAGAISEDRVTTNRVDTLGYRLDPSGPACRTRASNEHVLVLPSQAGSFVASCIRPAESNFGLHFRPI